MCCLREEGSASGPDGATHYTLHQSSMEVITLQRAKLVCSWIQLRGLLEDSDILI